MNVESIIGIIAGIFGIVTGCAWLHGVMKPHAKQKTAYSLLKQIADKNSTDVQRRKILNKLNKNKFVNGRISEATLLGMAVIGGSIGAWLDMRVWHHKTMHKKFQFGIPLIIVAQIVLIIGIISR